jgi:hypothetical protein
VSAHLVGAAGGYAQEVEPVLAAAAIAFGQVGGSR